MAADRTKPFILDATPRAMGKTGIKTSGRGRPPEQWDPFSQEPTASIIHRQKKRRKTRGRYTGLGGAVSHSLPLKRPGKVEIDSELLTEDMPKGRKIRRNIINVTKEGPGKRVVLSQVNLIRK